MRFYSVLLMTFLAVSSAFAISVEFRDEQKDNASNSGIRIRVLNDSGKQIENVKLRYFYKISNATSVEASGYYLANSSLTTHVVNDSLAYFEIEAMNLPRGFYPDAGGLSIGLHNINWSNRNKTADYSYIATSDFREDGKIVLYSNGSLIYGTEPAAILSSASTSIVDSLNSLDFRIVGFRMHDEPWIEIQNKGTQVQLTKNLRLADANGNVLTLANDSIGPGKFFRLCRYEKNCANFENYMVDSTLFADSIGEYFLISDTTKLSYIPWGGAGKYASEAVAAGIWIDVNDYFRNPFETSMYSVTYTSNDFYRVKKSVAGTSSAEWYGFTNNDDPERYNKSPNPVKLTVKDPNIYRLPGDDSLYFSWVPVANEEKYRIVVVDSNMNVVYNKIVNEPNISLKLADGKYGWKVLCGENSQEEFGKEAYSGLNFEEINISEKK